ncbi:LacI family DNA-binding transcriptional regulator [Devosia sp. CAU 1758]
MTPRAGQVKLRDVAKAAGVSQGTASNVFNRPDVVRPEVRERVQAVARDLGYAGPSLTGRLLRAGKVNAIGVATAEPLTYFFEDQWARAMMAALAAACDRRGAGLSLVSSVNDERLAWNIQNALVDGLVLLCAEEGRALIGETEKRELPFVALGMEEGLGDTPGVGIDNRGGAEAAARHLAGLGHRRVAILGIGEQWNGTLATPEQVLQTPYLTVRDRVEGYWAGMASVGVPAADIAYADTDGTQEVVWAAMDRLFALAEPPTAILGMSDRTALFAMGWLASRGRRVPEEVSVIGFDGVPEAGDAVPGLTSVQQPFDEIAERAVSSILEGELIDSARQLPLPLVVRGSTGPVAG